MNDPIAAIARGVARRLTTDLSPSLAQDVEVALLARDDATPANAYVIDPISLGSLIVAIATLAWTVRVDLQSRTTRADPEVLARTVRVRLREDDATESPERDRIIDIVVEESVRLGASFERQR